MSEKGKSDILVVRDRCERRQFIRTGTAFLLAGGALTAGNSAYGDECDRGEEYQNTSDSDAGSNADPSSRRACNKSKNSITSIDQDFEKKVVVSKVTT